MITYVIRNQNKIGFGIPSVTYVPGACLVSSNLIDIFNNIIVLVFSFCYMYNSCTAFKERLNRKFCAFLSKLNCYNISDFKSSVSILDQLI